MTRTCETCGQPIAAARLKAKPYARWCHACAPDPPRTHAEFVTGHNFSPKGGVPRGSSATKGRSYRQRQALAAKKRRTG